MFGSYLVAFSFSFMTDESKTREVTPSAQSSAEIATDNSANALTEDLALAKLEDHELTADAIEDIFQNAVLMKSRKVRMALAAHPHTPRRIALRVIRELYTFDLMRFAMLPAAAADLKQVADQALLTRLPSITLGERISLARRGSGMVAGALLLEKEAQVWQAALENPRLTEASVVKAVRESDSPALLEAIRRHAKWSWRVEVRTALGQRSPQLLVAEGLDGIEIGGAHGGDHAADDADDAEDRSGNGENRQGDD